MDKIWQFLNRFLLWPKAINDIKLFNVNKLLYLIQILYIIFAWVNCFKPHGQKIHCHRHFHVQRIPKTLFLQWKRITCFSEGNKEASIGVIRSVIWKLSKLGKLKTKQSFAKDWGEAKGWMLGLICVSSMWGIDMHRFNLHLRRSWSMRMIVFD